MLQQLLMKQAVTSVLLRHMKGMIWRRKGQWQVSQKQHPACAALTRCELVPFILTKLLIIKIHPQKKAVLAALSLAVWQDACREDMEESYEEEHQSPSWTISYLEEVKEGFWRACLWRGNRNQAFEHSASKLSCLCHCCLCTFC